jgi:hypothetical protein
MIASKKLIAWFKIGSLWRKTINGAPTRCTHCQHVYNYRDREDGTRGRMRHHCTNRSRRDDSAGREASCEDAWFQRRYGTEVERLEAGFAIMGACGDQ